jgi:hypothetical protein
MEVVEWARVAVVRIVTEYLRALTKFFFFHGR